MVVATPVTTDVRVLRESASLAEAGHEVHLIGRDVPAGAEVAPGVTVSSVTGGRGLRPTGTGPAPSGRPAAHRWQGPSRAARWLLLPEHRAVTFRRWAVRAERLASEVGYDVVHAHDFTALPLGDRLARRRGVPLVYDAHELWAARHRSGRPTPVGRRWQRRVEARVGGRAAAVVTVSEPLARRLRRDYGWDHVTVVRNTFPAAPSGTSPAAGPVAAVCAGRIAAGRDLATVAAASRLVDLPVRLVGPSDRTWAARFDPGACTVEPPVAPSAVEAVVRAGGLALVTLEERVGNHQVALPNKLFLAVRARVPVVASDVGELGRVVRSHGLGVVYRAGDPAGLAAAVDRARACYPDLVAAVARAGDSLSWETDRRALLGVYDGLGR